ncbi:MAG: hypothetical protein RL660_2807 [Bacteroidota bacterium]|jgi:predicted metalloprotease with PDZ domain
MKYFFTICLWLSASLAIAQHIHYDVDLTKIVDDKVFVEGSFTNLESKAAVKYVFPKVVPGTYAIEDYGKYVDDFKAFDASGTALPVRKEGNNTYIISSAQKLAKVTYYVNDAMDMQVKQNKIFEPASTNILQNSNIVMNNGGFFGCIQGLEQAKHTLNFTKPTNFFGSTSLPQLLCNAQQQNFTAKSYHQLVDCPILWCEPDTTQFMLNNTKVTISVFHVGGRKLAKFFYKDLKRDMEGIAKFLPKLPVDQYNFLIYVDDFKEYGPYLNGTKRPGLGMMAKLVKKFSKLGVGALEHGNSSFYYLADFGGETKMKDLGLSEQFTGAAIHEFMHIVTPLSLHSQHIGNFNYENPIMSKHLWLYEGCTEYFAQLIKLQADIYTPDKFFQEMLGKQQSAEDFPLDKFSITEMSARVLEKEEHKAYVHVYDRGAINAMLLDAQIIKLTKGRKNLITVMLTLMERYGADKSFDEESFIAEFVAEVHPDLQKYFDNCVIGRQDYDINKALNPIGIVYHKDDTINAPKLPFSAYTISTKKGKITRTAAPDSVVFLNYQTGDVPGTDYSARALSMKDARFYPEGKEVQVPVMRNGEDILVPYKIVYGKRALTTIKLLEATTAEQESYWQIFSEGLPR